MSPKPAATSAGPWSRTSSSAASSSRTRASSRATGATSPSQSASTRRPGATARAKASSAAALAVREGLEAGVPGPGRVRVDVGLLDLLADALEQSTAVVKRRLQLVARAPAQHPEEPQLLLGDRELDLVVHRGHPLEEAGAERLPERERVVLAGDGGEEALVELDALELDLAPRRLVHDQLLGRLLDRLDVERRHHLGQVGNVRLGED